MSRKPYPHYKNSGLSWLGEVPSHWDQLPGFAVLVEKQIKNTGLKEKTVLSLSYGKIVIKPVEKLHGLVPESFETYQIVEPGDIIIRSTDLQNDKVSLRVGEVRNDGIITSAYLCLRPKNGFHPRFAYLLLHGFDVMKVFYGLGSGLRQNLSWSDFKRLPFFLPNLTEQHKIARYLDWKTSEINQFIKAKKRQIELLKEQKQVLLNDAVSGKIDVRTGKPYSKYKDSGVDWIEKVPDIWEVTRIRNCIQDYQAGFWGDEPDEKETGIWCIRVADFDMNSLSITINKMTYRRISSNDLKSRALQKGDILIEKSGGGDNQPVGRAVLFNLSVQAFYSNFISRIKVNESLIKSEYLLYVFSLLHSSRRTLPSIKQTTGIQNLNERRYYSNIVALPPLKSQLEIINFIRKEWSVLDGIISQFTKEIALFQEYKTCLLADVVTGKVDVRDIKVPVFDVENGFELIEDTTNAVEDVEEVVANE